MKRLFSTRTEVHVSSVMMTLLLMFFAPVLFAADKTAIEGRWDMTVDMDGRMAPSWLEVRHSGISTLIGEYVADGGSARPISKVEFKDGKFRFVVPPQWEPLKNDIVVEGVVTGDQMSGTIDWGNNKIFKFSAVRAPKLKRSAAPVWGNPITLFNGKDLSGWHALGKTNQWIVEDGVLRSPKSGSNIATDATFNDFKLHVEFRYPKGSNSGVYLRGRYEVQIADNKGEEPQKDFFGAIYGFLAPIEMMAKDPGEWQAYDITLVGRLVTVVANGVTVICNQEIPGITGGALDSKESEPGPIYFQGDHGPVEFRNIVLTPAK